MTIINSTTYRFIDLSAMDLYQLSTSLRQVAENLCIKGTILLSVEGINLSLAGTDTSISQFKNQLNDCTVFKNLYYRDTYSTFEPFQKLCIKVKKQILAYEDGVAFKKTSAPYITPNTLLAWLDAKRDITLLDVRNQYEVEAGGFEGALHLSLKQFRDFPEQVAQLPISLQKKPVVTFCTGGIRCEKASATLLEKGFKEVYQLQGGILNYFRENGAAYYRGSCFVFDERNVVTAAALSTAS